jgi:hypothetical protein
VPSEGAGSRIAAGGPREREGERVRGRHAKGGKRGAGCERSAGRGPLTLMRAAHTGRVPLVAHATAHGHAGRPPLNAYATCPTLKWGIKWGFAEPERE